MEAILFTWKRKLKELKMQAKITVGSHEVQYNKVVTIWLGMWLDDLLTLNCHRKNTLANARKTQKRMSSLMVKRGLSQESGQTILVAAVQALALYGA